jgi:hypothetical protein
MLSALLTLCLLTQPDKDPREARIRLLTEQIKESGRVLLDARTQDRLADPRTMVPPGSPPLLRFRYFAGVDRHRFGKLDLMLDDAGH